MWRNAGVAFILLTACNAWVRPTPPPPLHRSPEQQRAATVRIESRCDPFNDGALTKLRVGSGVMVSDWQVLTALHVVECTSAIPTIKVFNQDGRMWKFAPEREWLYTWLPGRDGIARIQMLSADTLRPRLVPPTLREKDWMGTREPVYIQTAEQEKIFEATGWMYGGDGYGGKVYTYRPSGLSDPTEDGDSGSGEYDIDGALIGIHLGHMPDGRSYGAMAQNVMLP
jgi:hypothetical protein